MIVYFVQVNKCLVRKQRKYGVHSYKKKLALVNSDCIAMELRVTCQKMQVFSEWRQRVAADGTHVGCMKVGQII